MDYQKLYLVRHAESAMSGKYCGSTDAPLSAKGLRQARKIARFFDRAPVGTCYLSDLKRARQTVQFFNHKDSSSPTVYLESPRLREIHFGDWEAASYSQVSKRWPALYRRWLASPTRVGIPSGESFSDFLARVKSFSRRLLKDRAPRVLIVAHGGSLSVLTMLLLKKPVKQFWKWVPPAASITVLRRKLTGKKGGRFFLSRHSRESRRLDSSSGNPSKGMAS